MTRGEAIQIGILQLGPPTHGIHRYGRMIAAELHRIAGVSVIEREHTLTGDGRVGLTQARRAAASLSGSDVVMVPYCPVGLWSNTRIKLAQIVAVHEIIRAPTVSVLHDVYDPGSPRRSQWWAMALSAALPKALVIHSEHEREVLRHMPRSRRARLVPHFIEQRVATPTEVARRSFGLARDVRVLGMIGWIHPRKNYEFAVRLLAALPSCFQLWCVGRSSTSDDSYVRTLRELAAELGVDDRLLVTGYLDDAQFGARIDAVDVGICPYHDASASGSMSTLVGARKAVVANDFPFARDLRSVAPDAIHVVDGCDLQAFRDAVAAAAAADRDTGAFEGALSLRAPAIIAQRYLEILRAVA